MSRQFVVLFVLLSIGCSSTGGVESSPLTPAAPKAAECASTTVAPSPSPRVPMGTRTAPALGIDRVQLRSSNEGYLIDFRYRVLNGDLARPLLDRSVALRLVDPETGASFRIAGTAKLGSLRTTGSPVEGRTYYALFSNPAGRIPEGARWTLEVGDVRVAGIPVGL